MTHRTPSRRFASLTSCAVLAVSALACLLAWPALPAADPAPTALTAVGGYEHFRRTRIVISAPLAAAGKQATISAGAAELGRAALRAEDDGARAALILPMPEPGKPYPPLTCAVDGLTTCAVELPDADEQRRHLLLELTLAFRPAVFTGEKFPSCDFVQANLVEDLLGTYTMATTFYDAEQHVVTSAEHLGRYGAVVEVSGSNGLSVRRYVTIYRQPERPSWLTVDPHLTMTLPDALGVDPAVVAEQHEALGEYLKYQFAWSPENDGLAPLLAWMHEVKPGAGRLPWRLGPDACDARWWFTLRKRLGHIHHRYLTYLPAGYEQQTQTRFPLLIYLHGSGHRGFDFNDVRKSGPHRYLLEHGNPFILIEPQCAPGEGWEPCAVVDLLDELRATLRVDDQRAYLTGLSMGGNGTWATALEYPERFAAVAPICGGCDPGDAARMKDVPTWVFHGGSDPRVPVAVSQDMVAALERCGGKPRITIFPGAGHNVSAQVYATPELYAWMLQQRLDARPAPAAH